MLHPLHARRLGELCRPLAHGVGARPEQLRQVHAAGRRLRVQLEAAPVEVQLELLQQPDQAALLRDEAERSDEIAVEPQNGHASSIMPFARWCPTCPSRPCAWEASRSPPSSSAWRPPP